MLLTMRNQIVDLEVTGSRPVTRPILSRGWLSTPRALILAHGPEGFRNGAGQARLQAPGRHEIRRFLDLYEAIAQNVAAPQLTASDRQAAIGLKRWLISVAIRVTAAMMKTATSAMMGRTRPRWRRPRPRATS